MAYIEQHPRGWRVHIKVSGKRLSRLCRTEREAKIWAEREEQRLRDQPKENDQCEPRRSRSSMHVYIMVAGDNLKIGVTGSPDERWKKIQTANPDLSPLFIITPKTPFAEWIERQAHLRLQLYSVGGEWFRCDISKAITIIEELWQ